MPAAAASMILVGFLVVGIVLIPALDAQLTRAVTAWANARVRAGKIDPDALPPTNF